MATYSPSKITKDGNTYNFTDTTKIPLAGTNALSGSIIPSTDNAYDLGKPSYNFRSISAKLLTSNGDLNLYSSYSGNIVGSFLTLKKIDSTSSSGSFELNAHTETEIKQLIGYTNGTLTWDSKNVAMQEDVIPRSGGAVITGDSLYRTSTGRGLFIGGGDERNHGGNIYLAGSDTAYDPEKGVVFLLPNDNQYEKNMGLFPSGGWTWSGQAVQLVSDARLKQQIAQIDDKLLDAWEDVELSQFKYNDAVDQKKNNARLHTGYVVQQIDSACKSHGVDISAYGLYCHEEYAEETREVEHEDGTKTVEVVRPANEHYSLRYTEALIVECAYLRKCIAKLTARIEQLEKGNNIK